MGGKSPAPSGTTTSVQNSQPWSEQQPYLEDAFAQAHNLWQNNVPQYYPGQTYAPATNVQNDAINKTASLAEQNPLFSQSVGSNQNFLTGANLANDPAMAALSGFSGQNPTSPGASALQQYAQGDMASAGNPYTNAVSQSVLSSVVPQIQSQFIQGGGLSSPQAAYATTQGATSALAPSLFQNFQQEQQNQLGALGAQETAANNLQNAYGQNMQQTLGSLALAPSTAQMGFTDLGQLYNAGATDQANQQANINDAVNRYNYNTTLPYNMLNQFIGETTGNYGGTTALTQPYFANQGMNLLGGALGGASLGNTLLGSTIGSGAASAGGAGIGALLALL